MSLCGVLVLGGVLRLLVVLVLGEVLRLGEVLVLRLVLSRQSCSAAMARTSR